MKKYAFAFFLILFTASLALAIQDQKPAEKAEGQQPAEQKATKTITGEITSVDSTKNEVVLKDASGADVRFTVNESTRITKAGKTIQLADLKAGEKITVECEESASGCVAKTILVAAMKSEQ
ncbi:MAG TPA: hypothetical protein VNO14_17790 [Blastocatellia bacterium]|nr:hypothetical protein [Blastocatellia bacterium]